jgi:hypothetical protein
MSRIRQPANIKSRISPIRSIGPFVQLPDDPEKLEALKKMLENMGARGWSAMPVEGPSWQPVTSALPDADTTVLITCSDGNEPVWFGYFDGVVWLTVEGDQVTVTHWMHLPDPPAK